MVENSLLVRIPRERIGVLVGPKGNVKRTIEKNLEVSLAIESDSGIVRIFLSLDAKDPSMLFKSKEVVAAIGRGFSPENAFRLIFDDASLDIIELRTIFGKSEADIKRVKGRIIGMGGKTRKIIEHLRIILAIEILCACQAIDLARLKKEISPFNYQIYQLVRASIPSLIEDREINKDIFNCVELIRKQVF